MRRKERAQRRAQMSNEGLGGRDTEGLTEQDDRVSLGARAGHDENDDAMPQKHRRGPGDEEDYETPERPERIIEPLRLEGVDRKVNPVKQVKWHRGLSTAIYLDEVDPWPKSLPKNVIVRGCLAPTSKVGIVPWLSKYVLIYLFRTFRSTPWETSATLTIDQPLSSLRNKS